MHLIPKTAKCQ